VKPLLSGGTMKIQKSVNLSLIPGLVLSVILAIVGVMASEFLKSYITLSALILAILFGMLLRNTVGVPENAGPGVSFSLQRILRIAIIFLGFRLSVTEVFGIGIKGLTTVVIVISATLIFTTWIGKRFELPETLAILIGSGTGICGASAAIAIGGVINARDRDIAFAVAIVTIFGTVAMFLYPILETFLQLPEVAYGVWTGSSIHEVAQVVAASFAISTTSGAIATVVKLSRVLFLAPVAVILGVLSTKKQMQERVTIKSIPVPYFVFGFIIMVLINSAGIIPSYLYEMILKGDNFLLTMAMAAMGMNTGIHEIKEVGLKPFYAGFVSWIFIAILSYVLTIIVFGIWN